MKKLAVLTLMAGWAILAVATHASAQPGTGLAQVVALDECDPATFNTALGAGECLNVAFGFSTPLGNVAAGAQAGTPDPGWDFEPDLVTIH